MDWSKEQVVNYRHLLTGSSSKQLQFLFHLKKNCQNDSNTLENGCISLKNIFSLNLLFVVRVQVLETIRLVHVARSREIVLIRHTEQTFDVTSHFMRNPALPSPFCTVARFNVRAIFKRFMQKPPFSSLASRSRRKREHKIHKLRKATKETHLLREHKKNSKQNKKNV